MAMKFSVTIFTLLIAAVCLTSTTASTSRDPKQLLLPYSLTPLYRVQPAAESRYGPSFRQTNSPISPAIAQNGLGPFFGYFPNLLTQPCPACAACEVCPNCTVCPIVIPPPPAESFTTCGDTSTLSAAPNGTIKVTVTQTGTTKTCQYGIVAYYPNSTITLTCTALGTNTVLSMTPLATPVTVGEVNKPYTSKGMVLLVNFSNVIDVNKDLTATCAWTTVQG